MNILNHNQTKWNCNRIISRAHYIHHIYHYHLDTSYYELSHWIYKQARNCFNTSRAKWQKRQPCIQYLVFCFCQLLACIGFIAFMWFKYADRIQLSLFQSFCTVVHSTMQFWSVVRVVCVSVVTCIEQIFSMAMCPI